MESSATQQIQVLSYVIRKQTSRLKFQDPAPALAAAAKLASDGVCGRCLLRLAGHTNWDDYALPNGSRIQITQALTSPASSAAAATFPASEPPAAQPTTSTNTSLPCPTCFGLLQGLLEEGQADVQSQGPQHPSRGSQQNTLRGAATGTGTGTGVDLAWLRIQNRALPGSAGATARGSGGPPPGHASLPGPPSAAALTQAVRQQAQVGPPDEVEMAAAVAAAAASGGRSEQDVEMVMRDAGPGEGDDSGGSVEVLEAEGGGSGPVGRELQGREVGMEEAAQPQPPQPGPPLMFSSFALEVTAVPAACALRDAAMHAWMVSEYDKKGLSYSGWRLGDVVPLATVLRRALPLVLSRLLSVPSAAPQSAQLTITLAAGDSEAGQRELQRLAEDQAAHQASRRTQHPHPHHSRYNKRQRGGQQQQQQGAAAGAPHKVRRISSWEQAAAVVGGLPRPVLLRLFPWPPPSTTQPPPPGDTGPAPISGDEVAERTTEGPTEGSDGRTATSPRQEEPMACGGEAPAAGGDGPNGMDVTTGGEGPVTAEAAGVQAALEAAGVEPQGVETGPWARVYVRAVHAPLLLAGRYCKLRRHMPQCPWFVLSSGTRIGGTSVQEAIEAAVLPLYGTGAAKMVTGGREDADVRMLGAGRPFVMEVQAPLRGHPSMEALRAVEATMRESQCGVTVQGLTPCGRPALEAIKAAEESKEKTYRAVCWVAQPLSGAHLAGLRALGRVESGQDTPVRVLHRRAAKVRPRWLVIEEASAVPDRPHYFVLQLRTQAGTYVKEFCHGDFGRCRPSLGDLLGRIHTELTSATTVGGVSEEAAVAGAGSEEGGANTRGVGAVGSAAASNGKPQGEEVGAQGEAAGGDGCGGAEGRVDSAACFIRVEIVQLDVIDVHLEDWP